MPSLLEYVVGDTRLRTLHRGVLAIDLAVELVDSPYTLLAPVDTALARVDHLEGLFDDPDRIEELFDFFHFFLLRGIVETPVQTPLFVATVHGQLVQLGPQFVSAPSGTATILESVRCRGGMIHLLDSVVIPEQASRTLGAAPPSRES